MSQRQLVFPYKIWRQCQKQLFVQNKIESFAFGLARPCRRDGGIIYLVEHLLNADTIRGSNSYAYQHNAGLSLSNELSSKINHVSMEAAKLGMVPVHLHSHPDGVHDFSTYDTHHESLLHEWLTKNGQPFLWSLVWSYNGQPRVRFWRDSNFEYGIVRGGLHYYPPESGSIADLPALDRQNAFGIGLRYAAGLLHIGIVGVGGVGMLVAEQLARCGFRKFTLVDHDRVDLTNLNRLQGTFFRDVGKLKVRVARRQILQASKCIGVKAVVKTYAQDIYLASQRIRNYLQQCDVILALTDDELSRITCLEIALAGGAEYLQAGVDVRLDTHGHISGLFLEITGAEVNRYCPICTKRLDPGQASLDARRYVGGEVWERAKSEGYIPEVPAPAVMSINSMAAGLLVAEIQRRVSNLGVWDAFQLDIQSGQIKSIMDYDSRLPESCDVCGRRPNGQLAMSEPLAKT